MRYCIGDINGCYKTLLALVEKISVQDTNAKFYVVGDFIDRGPDAKSVLDYLIKLQDKNVLLGAVRGNHEQMFIESYESNSQILGSLWHANGALNTLKSFSKSYTYVLKAIDVIQKKYYKWIKSLPFYLELNDYFIVHAGINMSSDKPFNDSYSMIWTREDKYDKSITKGKKIIHGHTTIKLDILIDKLDKKDCDIINIDTGCVYTSYPGMGFLTAINLDNMELTYTENIDFN